MRDGVKLKSEGKSDSNKIFSASALAYETRDWATVGMI